MEEFRQQCHKDGGVCNVRTVCEHLNETFGVNLASDPDADTATDTATAM